ncbi:hypothetical protein P9112_002221 [Eukaryota sp. TZLM1-RC]
MYKKTIDKYLVGPTIGQGSFAKVKDCLHSETNERVAIKIIDLTKVRQQNLNENLKREISIMKKVQHANICGLKEVLSSKSRLFLVLEFCEGELFDLIATSTRLQESTAANYFHQLLRGLRFLHAHSIAHRDLKPENILLSQGVVKITDFGLSRLVTEDIARTTCGTVHYVSPDVILSRESGGYSPFKADVWSAGVVLYVMCAGSLPFDHRQGNNELFRQICSGKFPIPGHFSPLLVDLITMILTVDPDKRPSIDTILQHEWFRVHERYISVHDADVLPIDVSSVGALSVTSITSTGEIQLDPSESADANGENSMSFSKQDILNLATISTTDLTYMSHKKLVAISTFKEPDDAVNLLLQFLKGRNFSAESRSGHRVKVIIDDTVILFQVFTMSPANRVVMATKRFGQSLVFWNFIRLIKNQLIEMLSVRV